MFWKEAVIDGHPAVAQAIATGDRARLRTLLRFLFSQRSDLKDGCCRARALWGPSFVLARSAIECGVPSALVGVSLSLYPPVNSGWGLSVVA